MKLLLVDDDPDIRLARIALNRAGFAVTEATNGLELPCLFAGRSKANHPSWGGTCRYDGRWS